MLDEARCHLSKARCSQSALLELRTRIKEFATLADRVSTEEMALRSECSALDEAHKSFDYGLRNCLPEFMLSPSSPVLLACMGPWK